MSTLHDERTNVFYKLYITHKAVRELRLLMKRMMMQTRTQPDTRARQKRKSPVQRNGSVVKIKQPKYVRLQGLPNVHASLHENVVEYWTVMKCNVLAPEMNHTMVQPTY